MTARIAVLLGAVGIAGALAGLVARLFADPPAPAGAPPAGPPPTLAMGPVHAGHLVVVFSDYECSACALLERESGPAVRAIAASGRLRVEVRHFPLRGHRRAARAAAAAVCAARQGAGWEMHGALLASAPRWRFGPPSLPWFLALADSLGLDAQAFAACVADDAVAGLLAADLALGRALGLIGVPAVFIDGAPVPVRSPGALVRRVQRVTR